MIIGRLIKNIFILSVIIMGTVFNFSCNEEEELEPLDPIKEDSINLIDEMTLDGKESVIVYSDFYITFNNTEGRFFNIDGEEFFYENTLIEITDESGESIPYDQSWISDRDSLRVMFSNKLLFSQKYTVVLTLDIKDVNEKRETITHSKSFEFRTQEQPNYYDFALYDDYYKGEGSDCGNCEYTIKDFNQANVTLPFTPGKLIDVEDGLQFKLEVEAREFLIDSIAQEQGVGFDIYIDEETNKVFFYNPNGYLFEPGSHTIDLYINLSEYYNGEIKYQRSSSFLFEYRVYEESWDYLSDLYPLENSSKNKINGSIKYNLSSPNYEESMFNNTKTIVNEIELLNNDQPIEFENIERSDANIIIPKGEFIPNSEVKLNFDISTELSNDSFSLSEKVALDKTSMAFNVGTERADIISSNFVKTSYPVIKQLNYLIEEYDQGIIQLFEPREESKVYLSEQNDYLLIIKSRTDSLVAAANYDAVQMQFTYQMPSGLLNSTLYNFSIYSEKHATNLFSDYFQTSQFSTFKEKMSNLERTNAGWFYTTDIGREFGYTIDPIEVFDEAEKHTLLKLRGNLEETRWYVENIEEIIYEDYNDFPFEISWRDPEILGVPPSLAFNIRAAKDDVKLPDGVNLNYSPISTSGSLLAFICEYDIVMRGDYNDLKKKAGRYAGENIQVVEKLLESEYTWLNSNIVLNLNYTIPGLDVISSTYRIEYLLDSLLNSMEDNSPNTHQDMIRK